MAVLNGRDIFFGVFSLIESVPVFCLIIKINTAFNWGINPMYIIVGTNIVLYLLNKWVLFPVLFYRGAKSIYHDFKGTEDNKISKLGCSGCLTVISFGLFIAGIIMAVIFFKKHPDFFNDDITPLPRPSHNTTQALDSSETVEEDDSLNEQLSTDMQKGKGSISPQTYNPPNYKQQYLPPLEKKQHSSPNVPMVQDYIRGPKTINRYRNDNSN